MIFRAAIFLAFVCMSAAWVTSASAQSLPPLRPGANLELDGGTREVTIKPHGIFGTGTRVPWPVEYIVDVAVEGGDGQVTVTLVTLEQYYALVAGQDPTNPLLKKILSGQGSASVKLPAGDYAFIFSNTSNTESHVTYRFSFICGEGSGIDCRTD